MNKIKSEEMEIYRRIRYGGIPVAVFYPNSYFTGMSNLGFQWLIYNLEKERRFCVSRFFLEDRSHLHSPDTEKSFKDFRYIFTSISYELDYINFVNALKISGIEPESRLRKGENIIIGGGISLTINPEPISEFLDIVVLGDGEDKLEILGDALEKFSSYDEMLSYLFQFREKFYIPSFFDISEDESGKIRKINNIDREDFKPIRISREKNLNNFEPPFSNIISKKTSFSDTFLIEILRGCPMGCRFCWTGFNQIPPRHFSTESIVDMLKKLPSSVKKVGIVSSAIFEHRGIVEILKAVNEIGLNANFSSLRISDLKDEIIESISSFNVRTLTIAPETGGYRLRKKINKNFSNDEIFEGIKTIFKNGIKNLKLYFLVGVPGEGRGDLLEIINFVREVRKIASSYWRLRGENGEIVVSVNPLIPKPGTPLQYYPMEDVKSLKKKLNFLKCEISKIENVKIVSLSVREGIVQWVLSYGKRGIKDILKNNSLNISLAKKIVNEFHYMEVGKNPFFFYSSGMEYEYIYRERKKFENAEITLPCPFGKKNCVRCGVCK